ncbi:MAG TPA: Na+/H+ antiporter NhaA [Polyangiaceae bacterium]|nr:Na+/H+ antiporter NhaA [Polyangiaceae bacterium]
MTAREADPNEPRMPGSGPPLDPPGAWGPARRLARRARAPVERFLAIEASSGILLLGVACIALLWANSPWAAVYERLWHTHFGLTLGRWSFERDLHFWINDVLMTVFFFVAGLEIRREMHQGELSQLRRAALPLVAAVGGMIAPALIFAAFNHGRPAHVGWGIPMATDIAFAVGALALLGKRVPPALRILLLALAVIDDVGAILVIAVFYSADIQLGGFALLGLGLGLLWLWQGLGVRSPWAYLLPGAAIWMGMYIGGIHPTLAGVLLGLLTPVRAWFGAEHFFARLASGVERYQSAGWGDGHELLHELDASRRARREAVSPVDGLQHALHGWVAYGIMPLFAFANAGVPLGNAELDAAGLRVLLGVSLGLVVGKPVGIVFVSWLTTRLGVTALPTGIGYRQLSVVGIVAGIGFTMALFVAQLAFPPDSLPAGAVSGTLLETSKLAIISGSVIAAVLSVVAGRFLLDGRATPGAAQSDAEAEASTTS